ncbi:ATP12 family chaperone protein [Methylobrevis pamukkalensis]|uniref:ATP12 chaperone protein n=1 Tax=Methylobrevis pamukkalensis TaxID=1439726 RepID=A0A1E3H780_9HYPH|nr:ATP12 family protein [Methylobrevis pamukkalensis]ODN72005.1 ATP12 chaperone protein [Methylobrevis pamukkalensis]
MSDDDTPGDLFADLAGPTETDPVRRAAEASKRVLPKRFYKAVTAAPTDGLFAVHLDGRPVRTPGRKMLAVPGASVAEALVAEWAAQGSHIDPATMPLTRLANSAIDGVAEDVDAVLADAAKYAGSDLLCYRAEDPERLVARQTETWDPILKWAEDRLGVRFRLAGGVMFVAQDEAVVPAVRAALPRDPFVAAAVHQMTTVCGSVLLALAVLEGRLDAEAAFAAAHVDEDWNIELWGLDGESASRRVWRWQDMQAAARLAGK